MKIMYIPDKGVIKIFLKRSVTKHREHRLQFLVLWFTITYVVLWLVVPDVSQEPNVPSFFHPEGDNSFLGLWETHRNLRRCHILENINLVTSGFGVKLQQGLPFAYTSCPALGCPHPLIQKTLFPRISWQKHAVDHKPLTMAKIGSITSARIILWRLNVIFRIVRLGY
jgi:hypothetical protein